ncbi:hypothetical protein RHCRD62_10420 [Rhodococcus sp. RD6.2]|nr:hypothetical protein RHCRD62_10420 [Rhodococcus sp. RD6.2]
MGQPPCASSYVDRDASDARRPLCDSHHRMTVNAKVLAFPANS